MLDDEKVDFFVHVVKCICVLLKGGGGWIVTGVTSKSRVLNTYTYTIYIYLIYFLLLEIQGLHDECAHNPCLLPAFICERFVKNYLVVCDFFMYIIIYYLSI